MAQSWDVFVAHASEDKAQVAAPLAEELRRFGLSVWFDRFELKVGDSLVKRIDEGLAGASRGVVILSRHFFAKSWTNREYQGLVANEMQGGPAVIPVWHEVSFSQVFAASPPLAAVFAAETEKTSIPAIAFQIAEVVRPDIVDRLRASGGSVVTGPTVMIPLRELQVGPVLRSELSPSLRARATIIHFVFEGVLSTTLPATLEDFCRESDPESEIELWEAMAAVYLGCGPRTRTEGEQKALGRSLLAAALGDREGMRENLEAFPKGEAARISSAIDEHVVGRPIQIARNGTEQKAGRDGDS